MDLKRHAEAKINLGLHVLRRRADGFHDIETVFLKIPWSDHVRVSPAEHVSFTCSDPGLPTDESNLCVKAAQALARCAGVARGAAIHLQKHIPYGAGLGGGSSDAATTLLLLDRLWQTNLPLSELLDLGAELGSDVPFFLLARGETRLAVGRGRGEVLEALDTNARPVSLRFPYHLAVVVPPVHVSSAEAYRAVRPNDYNRPDIVDLLLSYDPDRWRIDLVNDFEAPLFIRYPELADLKIGLVRAGACYAALSGSGSALFGFFESGDNAARAAETVGYSGCRTWWGKPV